MEKEDKGAEIYERVARGDESAFSELFRMYSKSMVNYSFRYLGNWHEAEEAAQEIFLRLYRVAPRYERRARFSTFLYQVATNILLNWVRDHSRERAGTSYEDVAGSLGTEGDIGAELDRKSLLGRVAEEVARLPGRERAALVMVGIEGFSYEEASEVLGTSFRAVKSLVHRARERVRKKIKEEKIT